MLSNRLKYIRQKNNLTQEQLAEKLNTTKGTISNYENNHSTPSNEMLKEIAFALNISIDYLLGLTDIPTSYSKKDQEFFDFVTDPTLKRWFIDELPKSKEEDLRKLRKMWDLIKNEDN